jgi:hypothetical protein
VYGVAPNVSTSGKNDQTGPFVLQPLVQRATWIGLVAAFRSSQATTGLPLVGSTATEVNGCVPLETMEVALELDATETLPVAVFLPSDTTSSI